MTYEQECYALSRAAKLRILHILQSRGYNRFGDIPPTSTTQCNKVTTKLAYDIAVKAHNGQLDKGGVAYIQHPLAVGNAFKDPLRRTVAYLHDVIEDTPMTAKDLIAYGIPKDAVYNVMLLTRADEMEYFQYLQMLLKSQIAADVKLADLLHNTDITRLKNLDYKAVKRLRKYNKAIIMIGEQLWGLKNM